MIADIEKSDGVCSLTFVVDEFSALFLHPPIFSIKHSRSAQITSFIKILTLIKFYILVS